MQQQFGVVQLLECCPEGIDQFLWQIPDEADGVRQQHLRAPFTEFRQPCFTGGGPECREQARAGQHVAARKCVEQRALAGIRVTHQGDDRCGRLRALLARFGTAATDVIHGFFETGDPVTDAAPVNLEFCFTRTAGADTATETAHGHSTAGQTRQLVLQLRQLNLNLRFETARVLRENVQNQLGAVQHLQVGGLLDFAGLCRRQFPVKNEQVSVLVVRLGDQLLQLAPTDQRA